MGRLKIKLAIQLSTAGYKNVFSLTNAGYQVSASYKSAGFVKGNGLYNVYNFKIPH